MIHSRELSQPAGLIAGRPLNQRELRMCIFLASIVLTVSGLMAALAVYSSPRATYAGIGSLADFPPSAQPYHVDMGGYRVFVVNTGQQLIVLDALTPYNLYRLPVKWVPFNQRFEDPGTGSKFTMTGTYIEGPASRSMDRYSYEVAADGTIRISAWRIERGEEYP